MKYTNITNRNGGVTYKPALGSNLSDAKSKEVPFSSCAAIRVYHRFPLHLLLACLPGSSFIPHISVLASLPVGSLSSAPKSDQTLLLNALCSLRGSHFFQSISLVCHCIIIKLNIKFMLISHSSTHQGSRVLVTFCSVLTVSLYINKPLAQSKHIKYPLKEERKKRKTAH